MGDEISMMSDVHLAPGDTVVLPWSGATYRAPSWETIPDGWSGDDEYEYQKYLVQFADAKKVAAGYGSGLDAASAERYRKLYGPRTDAEYDEMLRQNNAMRAELDRRVKLIEASPTEWQPAMPIITNPEDVFGI